MKSIGRLAVILGAMSFAAACSGEKRIVLQVKDTDIPADGRGAIKVKADLFGIADGSVVAFTTTGGALTSSTAVVKGSVAETTLLAPSEDMLGTDFKKKGQLTAIVTDDAAVPKAVLAITFTTPTDGPALLFASAQPDYRIPADGVSTTTIEIIAKRVTATEVTVQPDSAIVTVPTSVPLVDGKASFVITAPTASGQLNLALSAGDAHTAAVVKFLGEGDALVELSGTFAQVTYGPVKIGNLVFLERDPQCVVAPTFLLVHVTQDGGAVHMTSETCDIQMPDVQVKLVGTSHTTVAQSFVDAINDRSAGRALDFEIATDEEAPEFNLDADHFGAPLVIGAELDDPNGPLPEDENDPQLKDHDHDGPKGVTVTNSSQGPKSVVWRAETESMSGHVRDADRIDGEFISHTETKVLGGEPLAPTITDLPAPYTMVRVDGVNGADDIKGRDGNLTSISCADVNAYAYELQLQAPKPNIPNDCSGVN